MVSPAPWALQTKESSRSRMQLQAGAVFVALRAILPDVTNLAHPKQRLLLTESNLAVKPTHSAPFTVTVRQILVQGAGCTRFASQHRLPTVGSYRSGKHTAMTEFLSNPPGLHQADQVSDPPWRLVDQAFV